MHLQYVIWLYVITDVTLIPKTVSQIHLHVMFFMALKISHNPWPVPMTSQISVVFCLSFIVMDLVCWLILSWLCHSVQVCFVNYLVCFVYLSSQFFFQFSLSSLVSTCVDVILVFGLPKFYSKALWTIIISVPLSTTSCDMTLICLSSRVQVLQASFTLEWMNSLFGGRHQSVVVAQ